jgi:hypothetical protein
MNMMIRRCARVWCLLAVLAGCSRSTAPSAGSGSAPRAKFTLDITPSLTGSRNTVLRSGDTVVTGDGINIAVKASTDANLYVGYCDRDRKLTIFPPMGSIEAKAGEATYMPAKEANITLDDQVGPEVLYVIGSRRRLDIADPELAAAISKVRPGAANVECGEALDQVLESKGPDPVTPEPATAPGAPPPAAPGSATPAVPAPAGASAEAGASASTATPAKSKPPARAQLRGGQTTDHLPPPAKLERGGYITWGPKGEVSADGDRDDIVVLRYSFTHVAR